MISTWRIYRNGNAIRYVSSRAEQPEELIELTSDDWGDPDCIESHPLNIVKLGLQPLESSTAVVSKVAAGISTFIIASTGNSISQGEVNIAGLPCFHIRR